MKRWNLWKSQNLNRGQKLGQETRLGPILSPLVVQVRSVRCVCFNWIKHCQKSWMPRVLRAQHILHPLHSWRRWHCCFTPDAAVCHFWKTSNPSAKSCCGHRQEVSIRQVQTCMKHSWRVPSMLKIRFNYTRYWFLFFSVQECRKKSSPWKVLSKDSNVSSEMIKNIL